MKITARGEKETSSLLSTATDLDPLLGRIGDARIVMLGEASHGTHEFYTWRTAISKRLIAEKGFSFIAVEGDWPDSYRVNRYVKGYSSAYKEPAEVLKSFQRWPTWMWANWEIAALSAWLKKHNATLGAGRHTGFYGLDVYSLWESMEALTVYLERTDPGTAAVAKLALSCFEKFGKDEQLYARHALSLSCRDEVVKLLQEVRQRAFFYNEDPEAALNTAQNAHIMVEAEKYYRSMLLFNDNSWNIRDHHMMETLERIMEFHGPDAKAIVWAHNTHIGDARYTDMAHAGMVNIGQLARERYTEKDVVLVGFGSYEGTVMAGSGWGAPMGKMKVPPARKGSIEEILHSESAGDRLLIFDRANPGERFNTTLLHRAIGVVYDPSMEEFHNYVPSNVYSRYDAFIYLDKTGALHPISVEPDTHQVPETFPFEY